MPHSTNAAVLTGTPAAPNRRGATESPDPRGALLSLVIGTGPQADARAEIAYRLFTTFMQREAWRNMHGTQRTMLMVEPSPGYLSIWPGRDFEDPDERSALRARLKSLPIGSTVDPDHEPKTFDPPSLHLSVDGFDVTTFDAADVPPLVDPLGPRVVDPAELVRTALAAPAGDTEPPPRACGASRRPHGRCGRDPLRCPLKPRPGRAGAWLEALRRARGRE